MNDEKISDFLRIVEQSKRLGHLKRHKDYHYIVEKTSFLPSDSSVSRRVWHLTKNMFEIPKCKICGSKVPWEKTKGGYYRTYCSSKCAHNDPDVKERTKNTNIERYGCEVPIHNHLMRQQIVDRWVKKYGVDNPAKSEEIKERISQSCIQRKNEHITKKESIEKLIEQGMTQGEIGRVLNRSQPRVSNLLGHLNLKTNTVSISSSIQREIEDFIKSHYEGNVIVNDSREISPYHLDIFLPDKKIAIEVNGVYWHSELAGKDRKYHSKKTQLCEQRGIHLVQIWDSEWINKQDQVKSRLLSKLGKVKRIVARKCYVQEIESSSYKEFLEENHIQGNRPATHRLGLMYSGELVAVMSFLKREQHHYELLRYCSIKYFSVRGGAEKLLKYFKKIHNPKSIFSYVDRRWNTGKMYEGLGFTFVRNTVPNYWYFYRKGDCRVLYSRVNFQKHKLARMLPRFDPDKTEWENMVVNGYDRIWDCGSSKWLWEEV